VEPMAQAWVAGTKPGARAPAHALKTKSPSVSLRFGIGYAEPSRRSGTGFQS